MPAPRLPEAQTAGDARGRAVELTREGIELLRKGQGREAVTRFAEAVSLVPDEPILRRNLGLAYARAGEDADAIRELERYSGQGQEPEVFRVLGELYERQQNPRAALGHYRTYLQRVPDAQGVRARVARLEREQQTEAEFQRATSRLFRVKYEGAANERAAYVVLSLLEEAASRVGLRLGQHPRREIEVVLYSNQQFRDVTRAPAWMRAIYDGKVRLPIQGLAGQEGLLRRVVTHEYVHVLLVQVAGLRLPTWFHEGVAQLEEGAQEDQGALVAAHRGGTLAPLRQLEGPFAELDARAAELAYQQSLAVVRFLVTRQAPGVLPDLLAEVARGAALDDALQRRAGVGTAELDARWRASLGGSGG
ncbi:MAG: hypothetical protein HYV08_09015 [Deltaproteobacteria bacterium]|nr:hypothetical protein [Deltaproteobacteria bacterium]